MFYQPALSVTKSPRAIPNRFTINSPISVQTTPPMQSSILKPSSFVPPMSKFIPSQTAHLGEKEKVGLKYRIHVQEVKATRFQEQKFGVSAFQQSNSKYRFGQEVECPYFLDYNSMKV